MPDKAKIAREKVDETWKFVPEMLMFVGPEEFNVVEEMREELSHPDWLGESHGHRRLYRRGCRGPLCKKAARDYGRKYMREAQGYGERTRVTRAQKYDVLLDLYLSEYTKNIARRLAFQAAFPNEELTNA